MSHRIVVQGDYEDMTVRVVRRGSRIVIKCERPGIASSVERAIVKVLAHERETDPIGFRDEGGTA